ncbi:serine/threonine-protein kinase [bacterium]|nr:serine/threonine-protein kinase [bacterium]
MAQTRVLTAVPPAASCREGAMPLGQGHAAWVEDVWESGRCLGAGAFASVKVMRDPRSGSRVAVKAVSKNTFRAFKAKTQSILEIQDERNMVASLNHPSIVKLLDWFESASHMYLVMEFHCQGDLLDFLMQSGPVPERDARQMLRCICAAIEYLRHADVVHRDVKPGNILIVDTGVASPDVRLADFGLARACAVPCGCQTICGTPLYYAPEVLRTLRGAAPGFGHAADMWSRGVTAYAALSALPPFDEVYALGDQILQATYEYDGEAWCISTPAAKRFVSELLTVDPEARLTATGALQHVWFADLEPCMSPVSRTQRRV